MDFFNFGGSGETIGDHVCEITVVDFKSKKAIFSCKSTNGEISDKDWKGLKKAENSLKKKSKPIKKTA